MQVKMMNLPKQAAYHISKGNDANGSCNSEYTEI